MKVKYSPGNFNEGILPELCYLNGKFVGYLDDAFLRIDWNEVTWDALFVGTNGLQQVGEMNLVIYNEEYGAFLTCNIDFYELEESEERT
jgi:hypothetical protein